MLMILGQGTFGKVFLAKLKHNNKLYAVKVIRKDLLVKEKQIESTLQEKDILLQCERHPFLVGLDYTFQSELRVYFVMPFIQGGELYKIFKEKKRFDE